MCSEQGEGYWTFAECVAQCGANSLKISEQRLRCSSFNSFQKKSLLEPQPTPRPFSCALGANKRSKPGKEDLVGPEIPQQMRFVNLGKITLPNNMYRARKTSPRFSAVRLSPVGEKRRQACRAGASRRSERLERLDEVSRVVLEVELAEPGRPP